MSSKGFRVSLPLASNNDERVGTGGVDSIGELGMLTLGALFRLFDIGAVDEAWTRGRDGVDWWTDCNGCPDLIFDEKANGNRDPVFNEDVSRVTSAAETR